MQDFRKLKVWEKSHDLTLKIYELTSEFPRTEIYGLTSQMRRASSSISTNIAEGVVGGVLLTSHAFFRLQWVQPVKQSILYYLHMT